MLYFLFTLKINILMDFKLALGIDMSKLTFDYALIDHQGNILSQGQSLNTQAHILEWIDQMQEEFKDLWNKAIVCMEHSGYYGTPFLHTLYQSAKATIWLESSLRIKRSAGFQRGKDDAIDALKIACYALDFQRNIQIWKPRKQNLNRLELLISHRDRLVKNLMSIRNSLKEEQGFIDPLIHQEMDLITQPSIDALQKAIEEFDQRIETLLKEDIQLARQSQIITSIPGFGQVIASKLILATHGFTRFNSARKLACYSGIAPFPHRSGTSIRGKTRVSHLANKQIKKMLHLAALVTIRKGNIMREYYLRKVEEGKNKMSVINAVRNKLIHILIACINNDTIYQKKYHHQLA